MVNESRGKWKPRIFAFLCQYCASAGADLAGVSRLKYPANIIPITVPCSGFVDMQYVVKAFEAGADGVLIGGCHTPSDCHFLRGNFKALKRVALMKKLLEQMGIEPERLRLEWISATEAKKFVEVVKDFVAQLEKLGPLRSK